MERPPRAPHRDARNLNRSTHGSSCPRRGGGAPTMLVRFNNNISCDTWLTDHPQDDAAGRTLPAGLLLMMMMPRHHAHHHRRPTVTLQSSTLPFASALRPPTSLSKSPCNRTSRSSQTVSSSSGASNMQITTVRVHCNRAFSWSCCSLFCSFTLVACISYTTCNTQ